MEHQKSVNFSILKGKVISEILTNSSDQVTFMTSDGCHYNMWHDQSCCESVSIDKTEGNLNDLIGGTLINAEEEILSGPPEWYKPDWSDESSTWTVFTLETVNAKVVITWHGESNGYYSESVSFDQTTP